MKVIQLKNVWEMYRIKFSEEGKTYWDDFWPLKDISFAVQEAETIGIIGPNGSGKSTILKLISGMLKPDKGEVIVQGKVSGLLELGAGFESEMTGRENIYTLATLYGLNQEQIRNKFKQITEFADIGRFINAPVKCYSQGMFVRLAFAIAINMDSNILLIDDILAVGDEYFQRKCIKKLFELKEQGKTIILVTHDMNMLHRLCKRAIFLRDGRLVKDDAIDKVIPLYTQMIGVKEGIAGLKKDNLSLVFNNGRLFLNFNDRLITPDPGAYTTFLMNNKWYSSLQADWQVLQENENKLIAKGKFYQLAMNQIWELEIINNHYIKWDIEIEAQEPLQLQEGWTNVMLTSDYSNWFTTLEKGEFPRIEEKDRNWQSLLQGNDLRKSIGVEARDFGNYRIPSFAIEQSQNCYRSQAQISNTDYLAHCRVLQYKTFGLHNYSATQGNSFIYFSGALVVDMPDINSYLEKLQDEFVLVNGKLKLTLDNGKGILSYNGIDLTEANHINSAFYVNGRWHSSNSAHWEIKKQAKDKIIATGSWPNLPLIQIWEIEIIGENSFLWKVSMELNEELDIEQQHFYVMGCKGYTHWFNKYGTGKFPDNFLETEMDVVQRCIPDGEIGLTSQDIKLPVLSIKFSNKFHNFAKIFNSDFYYKTRTLRIEKIEPEEDIKFPPGEYPCFELEIALNKDKRIYLDNFNILQHKKLRFVFDNGKGRIFWNDKELTKRLGLYTSLRSQGRWYDSASSALWGIKEKDDNAIRAFGKWLHLPISQFWKMKLQQDRIIELEFKMKVDSEIEIDRLQTNLMVSERYSQWLTSNEKGSFPLFKEDVNDDWDYVWSGGNSIEYIGVLGTLANENSLPIVKFYPLSMNSGFSLNIVNSDIYHRGRVLQYLDANKKNMSSSDYLYFNGKIIIE